MARRKQKAGRKMIKQKDVEDEESYLLRNRRSSMRVNLSYTSNLSDSGNGSLKRTRHDADETTLVKTSTIKDSTVQATKRRRLRKDNINHNTSTSTSTANVTVIEAVPVSSTIQEAQDTENSSITIMKEKEQQLNRSCRQLKDAIMNRTKALFDKENELAIKTSEVLATECSSPKLRADKIIDDNGSKTPTVQVNIGKNDQIVMSCDGKKKNPVQVNSMLRRTGREKEHNVSSGRNEANEESNHSIVSTPKKPRLDMSDRKSHHKTPRPVINIPVARLFTDDPNNSMSGINAPTILVSKENPVTQQCAQNQNTDVVPSDLDCTTSPILSQGTRRSRFLRLSLKKKLTQPINSTSLRLSSITTNESFIKQFPLMCSSFKEKQTEKNEKGVVDIESTTIIPLGSNHSDHECRTINLEEDVNISKTIVISGDDDKTVEVDNSNSRFAEVQKSAVGSRMEITGVSSNMPIISRSFQNVIRRSLNLDYISIPEKLSQSLSNTIQKQLSSNQNDNKVRDKEDVNHQESIQSGVSGKDSLEELNANTLPTSLNVNTSVNPINSQEQVAENSNKLSVSNSVINSVDTDQILERADTELIHPQNSDDIQNLTEKSHASDAIKSVRSNMSVNKRKKTYKKGVPRCKESNPNTEKENSDEYLSGPSTCSIRSSLKVNTSLDSVKKSSLTNKAPDFDQILTMIQESVSQDDLSDKGGKSHTPENHSSESELESISLSERIKNLSAQKKARGATSFSRVSVKVVRLMENEIPGPSNVSKKTVVKESRNMVIDNNTFQSRKNNSKLNQSNQRKSRGSTETRKSVANENISSNTEPSVVETTPYPASRSVLMKTMIKTSIATNSLDPRKFVDFSDSDDSENCSQAEEPIHPALEMRRKIRSRRRSPGQNSLDTVILDSSDETLNKSNQRAGCIIDETIDKSKTGDSSHDKEMNNKKENKKKRCKNATAKRKLFPLRENSQLVSFSAAESEEAQQILEVAEKTKPRKRRKITQQKKQTQKETTLNSPELINDIEPPDDESRPKTTVNPRKPRKIVRKKIVVKKVHNLTLLNDIMADGEPSQFNGRTSSAEFDLSKNRRKKKKDVPRNNNKIVIVITGLPKQDKDLVKSVIKALGSATLEFNVTPRTTHVVSSGIRTINLLKAIIRGCWLLSMEWVLRSLEANKWLDPNPYEMIHFSKAVQENRRDRHLFGKAYVPELFVTCGLIYVENGTSPPPSVLKDLIKIAGGRITEDFDLAQVIIGSDGVKENWVLDCITTGEMQPFDLYKKG